MSISGKQPGVASQFSVKEKNDDQRTVHEAGSSEFIPPSLLRRLDAWLRIESAGSESNLGPWSNADLEPTSVAQQTWSSWNCKHRQINFSGVALLTSLSRGILALRCNRSWQLTAWILFSDPRVILEISCWHYSPRTLFSSSSDHCQWHHRCEIAHTIHHPESCIFWVLLLILRCIRSTACRLLLVRDQYLQRSSVCVCCSCCNMAFLRQCPEPPSRKRQHHDTDAHR